MIDAVTERIRNARYVVSRLSPLPLLLRFGIFLGTLAGLALSFPAEVLVDRPLAALVIVALLPTFGPRRLWPTFAALVTVGGWLLATAGYGRPIALWRLLAVAALLYLVHTLCALVALLPYDVVLDPDLVVRWLGRAVAVVLATSVLGVLLVEVSGVGGDRGFEAAAVGGLAAAVLLSMLLGWLLRRR